jgi:hypothetical protein
VGEVIAKAKEKNPKNGVVWNQIRKGENGWKMKVEDIMESAAKIIDKQFNKIE